jgi:hypothetical protein
MLETDADRLNILRALDASDGIVIGASPPVTGLFLVESAQADFDEVSVAGKRYTLRCLASDIQSMDLEAEARVSIPGDTASYYVAGVDYEDGLAVLELRKE